MRIPFIAAMLPLIVASCGSGGSKSTVGSASDIPDRPAPRQLIDSMLPASGAIFTPGSKVTFSVKIHDGVQADSIAVWIDDGVRKFLDKGELAYTIPANALLGEHHWHARAYAAGDSSTCYGKYMLLAAVPPKQYGFKVKNSYPHSTSSYTQGLLWHDGFLYEGTGLEGQSALLRVDLATGKAMQRHDLDAKYFGEGIAMLADKIFQLTWQNNAGFIYDRQSFTQTGQWGYNGEGWGLTEDGKLLYMSDGTNRIKVLDPVSMKPVRTIEVCTNEAPVPYLNELEWINGEIWANIYTTSTVVRIDPATGRVAGVIDFSGILPDSQITRTTDVMNGIAYDCERKRIFVTGKNWSRLFEVEISEKK